MIDFKKAQKEEEKGKSFWKTPEESNQKSREGSEKNRTMSELNRTGERGFTLLLLTPDGVKDEMKGFKF
ncbi:hypothetical protein JTE90_008426 [Oedothorax gibbosus]|uniref:Uncharacterized protein n=1 Tax=Oedothorax gibbosus TaxID=931172 RepID=A0AAV6UUQ2_9ARAC|nr:hypothetical protein JTE90_008426 [Oedothorax gibbosus]